MIESDDYKKGWYDGYQAAKKDQSVNIPTTPYIPPNIKMEHYKCPICGSSGVNGYVCYNTKCPTKVVSYRQSDFIPVNK
jgi:hypothetical protein